jgi:hypothetical protein
LVICTRKPFPAFCFWVSSNARNCRAAFWVTVIIARQITILAF